MVELSGEYTVTMDAKNRVAIPAQLRNALPEDQRNMIVLTRDFSSPCITGYRPAKWKNIENQFDHLKLGMNEKRALRRHIYPSTKPAAFDQQGRILIPPALIEYAQLDKDREVLVTGCGEYIEIWNPELYQQTLAQSKELLKDAVSQLFID